MVSIQVEEEKIREIAFNLSQEQKSLDDLVWLFAEAELRLRPAYVIGKLYKDGDEAKNVEIEPSLIVETPLEDDIRVLAEELSKNQPKLEELHWYIAERKYIYDAAKASE
jgi:hypothetical protein